MFFRRRRRLWRAVKYGVPGDVYQWPWHVAGYYYYCLWRTRVQQSWLVNKILSTRQFHTNRHRHTYTRSLASIPAPHLLKKNIHTNIIPSATPTRPKCIHTTTIRVVVRGKTLWKWSRFQKTRRTPVTSLRGKREKTGYGDGQEYNIIVCTYGVYILLYYYYNIHNKLRHGYAWYNNIICYVHIFDAILVNFETLSYINVFNNMFS